MNWLNQFRCVVFIVYLVIFSFLIFYDQSLSPEVQAEMNRVLPDVRDPDNCWVAILGVSAPTGKSSFQYGLQVIEDIESNMRKLTGDYHEMLQGMPAFEGQVPQLYDREDGDIFSYVSRHPLEVSDLIEANKELLERYDELRTFSQFTEPLNYGQYLPVGVLGHLRYLQRGLLLSVVVKALQGETDFALARLSDDVEFWRFCARESRTIISKLIAMDNLKTAMLFSSEFPKALKLSTNQERALLEILRPFDRGEVSMTETYLGERFFFIHYANQSYQNEIDEGKLSNWCYKLGFLKNRTYQSYERWIQQSRLSAREYHSEVRQDSHDNKLGLFFLYDPLGELMVSLSNHNAVYITKAHELEGRRRLAVLKSLIHLNDVPEDEIPTFLKAQAPSLGNPFTDQSMEWDAEKRVIFFYSANNKGRLEVKI